MFFPGILKAINDASKEAEASVALEKTHDCSISDTEDECPNRKSAPKSCTCTSWQLFRGDGCTCGGK